MGNIDTKKFKFTKVNTSIVEIRNVYDGHCLDVQYGGTYDNTPVWLYKCNGSPTQKWKVDYENATAYFINPYSGKYLTVNSQKLVIHKRDANSWMNAGWTLE